MTYFYYEQRNSNAADEEKNFINKGKKGLRCNRTACSATEAYHYNRVTKAYYCQPCAMRINESSNQSNLGDLCTLSKEDKDKWLEERNKRRYGET